MDYNKIRKLADSGNADAIYQLGLMYESGDGVITQDTSIALKRFRQAARMGHKEAGVKLEEISKNYNLNYEKPESITKQEMEPAGTSPKAPAPIEIQYADSSSQSGEQLISVDDEASYNNQVDNTTSGYRSIYIGFGALLTSGIFQMLDFGELYFYCCGGLSLIGGVLGYKDLGTMGTVLIDEGAKKLGKRKFKKFMIRAAIGLCVLNISLCIAISGIRSATVNAQKSTCITNLRIIEGAIEMFAIQEGKPTDHEVTLEDLKPYFPEDFIPRCPLGGTYEVTIVDEDPTCTVEGHTLHEEDLEEEEELRE